MARRLVWSPEAIEDAEAIASYIERDSPWYAKAVVSKIVEVAESIPDYPELGRVYSYRLIYRIEAERILIAALIHGSRLLQPFVQRIEGKS
jgi:toxin ParE1/3/4